MDYARGSIYKCNLPAIERSSIQRGYRPVLIISNNLGNINSDFVIVAPMTSKNKKPLPTHYEVAMPDGKVSTILFENIVTLPKYTLSNYITQLDCEQMKEVDTCIAISLGLAYSTVRNIQKEEERAKQAKEDLTALVSKIPHAVQLVSELTKIINRWNQNKPVNIKQSFNQNKRMKRTIEETRELIQRFDAKEDRTTLIQDFQFNSYQSMYSHITNWRNKI